MYVYIMYVQCTLNIVHVDYVDHVDHVHVHVHTVRANKVLYMTLHVMFCTFAARAHENP
jgi:hypothetical protein